MAYVKHTNIPRRGLYNPPSTLAKQKQHKITIHLKEKLTIDRNDDIRKEKHEDYQQKPD